MAVPVARSRVFRAGTRDELAELALLEPLVARLGKRVTLELLQHADHTFHVLARTGRKDAEIRTELVQTLAAWVDTVVQ
ncbi:MAG TPA: alpha/beta family hydrolase [Steroidobacteraceae bacterium]|nr:alpha/beta family hydrolase [Steroidobacteraceae bacterium]